jgi:hypothetical protein
VIRHFGRGAGRARALQERRQIAAEAVGDVGRLTGMCSLCHRSHGFPNERIECSSCGREACFGGCEHRREG